MWLTFPGHSARAQSKFAGLVETRRVEVDANTLVRVLGGAAGDPVQVFSLSSERIVRLKEQGDPGVQVKEEVFRVRDGVVRADVPWRSGPSFVLIRVGQDVMEWVHPGERTVIQWRKPPILRQPTPSPTPALQPLQRTVSLGGLEAEGYQLKRGSEIAWVWIARSPAGLAEIAKAVAALSQAIKPEAERLDDFAIRAASAIGFPARVQAWTARGYTLYEVVRVEPKEQPAEDFAAPRDFRRVSTGDLQGGKESRQP